jgi:hypothetical protein
MPSNGRPLEEEEEEDDVTIHRHRQTSSSSSFGPLDQFHSSKRQVDPSGVTSGVQWILF